MYSIINLLVKKEKMLLNFWRKIAATGRLHLDGFDSSAENQQQGTPLGYPVVGAGNRNRTGTRFTARDFKSLVSTYSTMPAHCEF